MEPRTQRPRRRRIVAGSDRTSRIMDAYFPLAAQMDYYGIRPPADPNLDLFGDSYETSTSEQQTQPPVLPSRYQGKPG